MTCTPSPLAAVHLPSVGLHNGRRSVLTSNKEPNRRRFASLFCFPVSNGLDMAHPNIFAATDHSLNTLTQAKRRASERDSWQSLSRRLRPPHSILSCHRSNTALPPPCPLTPRPPCPAPPSPPSPDCQRWEGCRRPPLRPSRLLRRLHPPHPSPLSTLLGVQGSSMATARWCRRRRRHPPH